MSNSPSLPAITSPEHVNPAPAPRGVLLTVAYHGGAFHGFAPQTGLPTVCGTLLDAVRAIDPSVEELRGASRTDAGVHARGQLVAFDTQRDIPARGWVLALASKLPDTLSVRAASPIPPDFTPHRHGRGKHYRYTLLLDACRDPFWAPFSWRLKPSLRIDRAQAEARALLGTHDFAAFRSSADQRTSTERTLHEVSITRWAQDPRLVFIDVRGSAFLHNMVRIIVGSLVELARGTLTAGAFERAFASCSRADLGLTAPPQGLCLESVNLDLAIDPDDRWPRSSESSANAASSEADAPCCPTTGEST